jgi:predicted ArsR family transcriptional regulator
MLKRLLTLIAATDGVRSLDELARAMSISQPLVEQLMTELVRMGYLRAAEGTCAAAACSGCPVQSGCQPGTTIGLWELTDKGRRLLAELGSADSVDTRG